jgi:hypothetical protein
MKSHLAVVILFLAASAARGGGEEKRVFAVSVDKKAAGNHLIVIQPREDGAQVVKFQSDITVRAFLKTYRYSFQGTEIWKEGRLLQMSTATNDDGKKHAVAIETVQDGLSMKADGKQRLLKGEFWVTTYWKLPGEKNRGPNVMLLDADTGKLLNAKLEKVGNEKIAVVGKLVECAHYKLSGDAQVQLWFDGDDRLVRQESIEDGHQVVLELTRLQRD